MAPAAAVVIIITAFIVFLPLCLFSSVAANWCVARSDATDQALQTALDYACGAGADCAPLQPSGLCFLPNTLQAHASYAFNSYFQRRANAPDSCSFAGTSTIARTDPSYGSCVYPSSPRNAGLGSPGGTTTSPGTTPVTIGTPQPGSTTATPIYGGVGGGGSTPDMGPGIPDSSSSDGSGSCCLLLKTMMSPMTMLFLVLWFVFKPCW